MNIWVITLFPEVFNNVFEKSIIARAQKQKLTNIKIINLRDFAKDSRKTVDDKPYGGGAGMVLKVDIIAKALESIKPKPYTILLSASGKLYSQKYAQKFSKIKNLCLICGHYEGIDARAESLADEIISVGDYVMTGGEIAAMAMIDSTVRLTKGVISKDSIEEESFSKNSNLLEFPQYTRPEIFNKLQVPEVLLSGNHQEIQKWRMEQKLLRTKKFRPDLLKRSK